MIRTSIEPAHRGLTAVLDGIRIPGGLLLSQEALQVKSTPPHKELGKEFGYAFTIDWNTGSIAGFEC